MKWQKESRLFAPSAEQPLMQLYGILPTPVYDEADGAIRIYFASTGPDRIGRIFSMLVDADDPSTIRELSRRPLIEPGPPASFDDCGVNPSCILQHDGATFLYYIGYQRSVMSPYLIFTGLAISEDGGKTFRKHSTIPVLDRIEGEYFIRSAPSIVRAGDELRMWYVSATAWEDMESGIFSGRRMPVYSIKHARSTDGIHWNADPASCIQPRDAGEFGFGRPWVLYDGDRFRMWYSRRRRDTTYRIGYAESQDGLSWVRRDEDAGIDVSAEGWDSEMICYAAVVRARQESFMFYNGNRNGETGFGYARLQD
jgi:predicted GH43/DUF377 family glycosyl hydrolase